MYPNKFDYHCPNTLDEIITTLDDNPDSKILAGGHSLIPSMKTGLASPDTLVDIGGIDQLRGIEHRENETYIGALTRYASIHNSERLWEEAAVLAEAAGEVGDVQVRNRGTIGGNIAHADPASDLPGAVLAMDATVHVQGPSGEREIPVDEFFYGMYATDVGESEILTGISIPHQKENTGSAYVKRPSPSSGYALVGVAVVFHTDGNAIESARVAVNGVMDRAVRLSLTEELLEDVRLDNEMARATAADCADDDLEESMMMEDIHASSEFRANLLQIFTKRALDAAVQRCV